MPDDKLYAILYELVTWSIGQRRVSEIEFDKATAQLNALFLSQALDLIDQQVIKVWGGIKPSDKYAVSTEELKAAFQAKYGGK